MQRQAWVDVAVRHGVDFLVRLAEEDGDPFGEGRAGGHEGLHFGVEDGFGEEVLLGDVEREEGEVELLGEFLGVGGESGDGGGRWWGACG